MIEECVCDLRRRCIQPWDRSLHVHVGVTVRHNYDDYIYKICLWQWVENVYCNDLERFRCGKQWKMAFLPKQLEIECACYEDDYCLMVVIQNEWPVAVSLHRIINWFSLRNVLTHVDDALRRKWDLVAMWTPTWVGRYQLPIFESRVCCCQSELFQNHSAQLGSSSIGSTFLSMDRQWNSPWSDLQIPARLNQSIVLDKHCPLPLCWVLFVVPDAAAWFKLQSLHMCT